MVDVVAVDLGGTNIRAARVGADGKVLARDKTATKSPDGMAGVVRRISELVQKVRGPETVGVGVGTPGVPDPDTGNMRLPAVNVASDTMGYPLTSEISKHTKLPVCADNDANVAALGEAWLGAGKGEKVVLILTLGTGIGGGLVVDGEVYHGSLNMGTEFGHLCIEYDGRPCACGNTGCLETYASAAALGRDAQAALKAGSPEAQKSLLMKMCGTSGIAKVDAQMVCDAAKQGDDFALGLLDRWSVYFGAGISGLANAFNPSCVVVGGGMALAGDFILTRVKKAVDARFVGKPFEPIWACVTLKLGTLGDDAGLMGAARLALQRVKKIEPPTR